jgi:hypothetical protein
MWFRAMGLTSMHCWLITSASAVLSSRINYPLSFEYRTALSGHENKKEIPGKHPWLSAVLPDRPDLIGLERKCASYLLC